jgi:TPR repeat protein
VTGSSEGGRPGEGEGRWSPPAEVAALYYPEEELGESAAGETRDEEEIDIAAVAPQDVGAAAAGSASASASASSASAASASSSASASAGSSRLVTVEPFDRSELSCADTGATGATLAMPVVPDEEDTSGEEVQASASHVSDPGALIAIEQGIRAKASGDIDGALAAWTPYARHGNATAQYLVGMLYLTGDAVPRNLRTAYAWFGLAAGQGHQLATCELIRLEQRMSPEDVALAVEQARDLSSGSGQ